ncbi:hypothetical protein LL972_14720 [Xanthomonas campestris pv. asclepiadis]|nr:hypothetical protein [Xanthomonas campestris]MCC4617236.1 hypothetical protein [Xanthomonas campestris pv. asclepiadis]
MIATMPVSKVAQSVTAIAARDQCMAALPAMRGNRIEQRCEHMRWINALR